MVVKYADSKPRSLPRRSVVFEYEFDDFKSNDEFLVVDLGGLFDCVFGMPWLARHRPDVDWLNCMVKPRDIDVPAVLACLTQASKWAVVDPNSTTHTDHEASDGPLCVACFNATCVSNIVSSPNQWITVSSRKISRSQTSPRDTRAVARAGSPSSVQASSRSHAPVAAHVGQPPSARVAARTSARASSRAGLQTNAQVAAPTTAPTVTRGSTLQQVLEQGLALSR